MTTYTITFGEVAENGVNMEQLGEKYDEGFTIPELQQAKSRFREAGYVAHFINLKKHCPKELNPEPAGILLVKNAATLSGGTADDLLEEQEQLTYDVRKFMRGKVVNSRARYNICFADYNQEADIPEGKGTVVSFDELPYLSKFRQMLPTYLGPAAEGLYGEGNKYYDLKKCGIGYHGDTERRIVIGLRLGDPMDLAYLWFYQGKPVGSRAMVTLDPGDLYVMSDKAVGYDWRRKYDSRKRLMPTLRHSAGCDAFTKIPE